MTRVAGLSTNLAMLAIAEAFPMNTTDLFKDLYRHMEWADALIWSTVLPDQRLAEDFSIRERLYHLHLVQRVFLHVWRGEPVDIKEGQGLRAAALCGWSHAYHRAAHSFVGSLRAAQLDQSVHLPWTSLVMERYRIDVVDPSLGETVMQVASHSTHHRGQVAARIRELGAEPPLTDFIAWVWSKKPAPSWPKGTEEHAPDAGR